MIGLKTRFCIHEGNTEISTCDVDRVDTAKTVDRDLRLSIDDEVTAGTAKASVALTDIVQMSERGMESDDTELKLYKAVVLPTLLYACETWTIYQVMSRDLTIST